LKIAVGAGVGSIEHGFFMDRETLAVMRDKQIAWTPTFCPVHFQWAHPEAAGWSADTVGNLRRILDGHAEHLRLAAEMGVPLLIGTDAGSMGVEHGHALFDEIDRYLDAGLGMARRFWRRQPRRPGGTSAWNIHGSTPAPRSMRCCWPPRPSPSPRHCAGRKRSGGAVPDPLARKRSTSSPAALVI
jgi:hypothetical protein